MSKFVYRNKEYQDKMYEFYDKSLNSLNVTYEEKMIQTTYGQTHILILGDRSKKILMTLHGGNGINPLNIKIIKPLLQHYCIVAPDVIGMPGKSSPYRTLSSFRDDYGIWLDEVMGKLKINQAMFVVSSYSSAMMLSLAKFAPNRIQKAVLIVPSGIAHGPLLPIISRMSIPFIKYYIHPSSKSLEGIMNTMISDHDVLWEEFMSLMMFGYKMEMRPPREYKKKELQSFHAPVFVIASKNDVFFPADRVFPKAKSLLQGTIYRMTIEDKHLPSEHTMNEVCKRIVLFDKKTTNA